MKSKTTADTKMGSSPTNAGVSRKKQRISIGRQIHLLGNFVSLVYSRFREERCFQLCGSLTFTTLLALVPLVTTFDLRMQRDEVPLQDMAAAVVAGLCILAMLFGVAVSIGRVYRSGILTEVMQATVKISAMVFVILLGASVFSLVFRGLGGDEIVEDVLKSMPGGAFGAMLVVMALMFVMGFFLDFIEIVFVVVPIVGPVLLAMGLDPIWLGVMIAVNLQTSFLTPPFGFALFYLRGVAPPSVTTMDIYRGIIPFVIIQVVGLILIAAFPGLATYLPEVLFR